MQTRPRLPRLSELIAYRAGHPGRGVVDYRHYMLHRRQRRLRWCRRRGWGRYFAVLLLLTTPALAAEWSTFTDSNGDSTTFGPDGIYHTFRDSTGDSTTFTPHGTYQTFRDSNRDSTTFGPDPRDTGVYVPPSVFSPRDELKRDLNR